MALKDFARITDLFVEGEEVVLKDVPGTDPILVWINKLNSFEAEECRRDGQAARSRIILALKVIGSPESDTFEASLAQLDITTIKAQLVEGQGNDLFLSAYESIRRDAEWAEKLSMSQRRGDATLTDEEKALLLQVDQEYAEEMEQRIANGRSQALRDLDGFDLESLQEKFREEWRDQRGMTAFTREYNKTRLFFSVRVCSGKKVDSGWDHGHCGGHRKRMLDDRDEVAQLPGQLLDTLMLAVQTLMVPRNDARFLAEPASSSESSAPPSEAAESTPSTPAATSPELATTSS